MVVFSLGEEALRVIHVGKDWFSRLDGPFRNKARAQVATAANPAHSGCAARLVCAGFKMGEELGEEEGI